VLKDGVWEWMCRGKIGGVGVGGGMILCFGEGGGGKYWWRYAVWSGMKDQHVPIRI
jgi:hypothetical protein